MSKSEKLLSWSTMSDGEKEIDKREFEFLMLRYKSEDESYHYANTRFDYIIIALSIGGISICYNSLNINNRNYFICAIVLFILSIITNLITQRVSMSLFIKTRNYLKHRICEVSGIENDYKDEDWDKENYIIPVLDYISIILFILGIGAGLLSLFCSC